MDEIKRLREEMARIHTNARAKLEEITDDTPEARAAEIEAEFDKMMAEFDKLEAQCERLKKLAATQERMNAPDPRRPQGNDDEARDGDDQAAPEYKEVFEKALRYGAATLNAEERQVLMSQRQDLPEEVRAQATGTDSAGGYVVPEGFSGEVDKALAIWGPMWDANIIRELNTTTGNRLPWPTIDDTGKTGRIKAENAAADDDGTDDVVFGEKVLDAFIYDTGIVRVPLELLTDGAFDMETLLAELFGERLGRTANTALTTGTGSGQPNGIVTASALGLTAASATAIAADEMMDLLHSVDPAYRQSPKARWQFNDTTLLALRKLKDGQGNYLWQMGDIRSAEPSMVLNHPYSINQAMASIATGNKSVIFGDHSRYIVRKVMGFQVLVLRERYAERLQVGMLAFKRFDGELLNTAAVKHLIQL